MTTAYRGESQASSFDALGPQLYRQNAFRITGLAVDATARDIRQRSERLRVMERLGSDPSAGSAMLPLPGPADPAAAQEAAQRLRDPVRRLTDEFFWFWPTTRGEPDEAIAALRRGDVNAAAQLWQHPKNGPATPIAEHNLAVLAHARALDRDELDADGRLLWGEAFAHWRWVFSYDAFWDLLDARVLELADPRLTTATTRQMRTLLPDALLSINAQLAVEALQGGRDGEAAQHIALMRRSGFAQPVVDEALRRAVEPTAARIRTLGENAERDADADPESGAGITQRLLDQTVPLLSVLGSALPADHPLLQGARDEVARRIVPCLIPYVNETDDWSTASRLLEHALPIAATESIKTRIQENLDAVRNNLRYRTCWFCKKEPATAVSIFEVKMHGDVDRTVSLVGYNTRQLRTTWRNIAINVPRCVDCALAHQQLEKRLGSLGTVITSTFVGLAIILFATGAVGLGILALLLDVALYFVIASTRSRHLVRRRQLELRDFEPIRVQLASGWAFGEKPPGVK